MRCPCRCGLEWYCSLCRTTGAGRPGCPVGWGGQGRRTPPSFPSQPFLAMFYIHHHTHSTITMDPHYCTIVVMHVEHTGLRNTIHHLRTHPHTYIAIGQVQLYTVYTHQSLCARSYMYTMCTRAQGTRLQQPGQLRQPHRSQHTCTHLDAVQHCVHHTPQQTDGDASVLEGRVG